MVKGCREGGVSDLTHSLFRPKESFINYVKGGRRGLFTSTVLNEGIPWLLVDVQRRQRGGGGGQTVGKFSEQFRYTFKVRFLEN